MRGTASRLAPDRTQGNDAETGGLCFAGLLLDRPLVMGIVNVTPDSFYDGGYHPDPTTAIAHGRQLLAEGADILDIGGESTRPGAPPVKPDAEIARVVPVVAALAGEGALVSIDTRRARVMRAAIEAGAKIVNDVTALTGDPDSLDVVAQTGVSAVLMHMQGDPQTMQISPTYDDVVAEVSSYLANRVAACRAAGIPPERLSVDPGIGFGKTPGHNLDLLASIGRLARLGVAVTIGVSRKGFIGTLDRGARPNERLPGSLVANLAAAERGAHILRVHDVAAMRQALAVWQAIRERE